MNRVVLVTAVLSVLALCYPSGQAVALVPVGQIQRMQISLTSGRPIGAAILEIERQHGVAISYEDLPLVYVDDVEDVTLEVRRDLAEFAARGESPPPVIVPRGGEVSFSYDINRATGVPISVEGMLAALLQASTDAGNAGTFRVSSGRGITHVIPVASKDATGAFVAVTPVLDSVIGLSVENGNGHQVLEAFCEAVSRASGERVVPGTIPVNAFLNTSITLDENQGVARDVLVDILAQLPVRLSWRLLYGPDVRYYALNLHLVE
jgi:hypothetical protein